MKKILILVFMATAMNAFGQFTKEKLRDVLSGKDQKSWQVKGVNVDRPEKTITFNVNYSAEIENQEGKKQQKKWALQSADNIRWFITIGETKYELIVSYNKKGEQYVKLTHQTPGDEYEMRLLQAPSKK